MTDQQLAATRDGFGQGLVLAAQKYPAVLALSADLSDSLRLKQFRQQFPSRYIECGVAEQNLAGVAAGTSLLGKIPFACSFATFNPGRNFDQWRTAAYSNLNVKIVASHAGISTGEDGAIHQALEDLSLMLSLPKLTVVSPADAKQAQQATLALAKTFGPSYLRLSRLPVSDLEFLLAALPNKVERLASFKLGQAQLLATGQHLTIVATGNLVQEAIKASLTLYQRGIEVELINVSTLKPLDLTTIIESCSKTRALIIASEEQLGHGFNAYLSQQLAQSLGQELKKTIVLEVVAVNDRFGESGTGEELLTKYQLDSQAILNKALNLLKKKQSLLTM